MPPPSPAVFEEAERWFRERAPMSASEARALDERSRRKAFAIAGVEQARVADAVLKSIARAVRDGESFEEWKRKIEPKLRGSWGRLPAGQHSARLEAVFRTTVQSAYNAARRRVLSRAAVKALRPFWRFEAVLDERTSATCSARHGTVLLADDPWWDDNQPPLHIACRSSVRALSAAEARRLGVDRAPSAAPAPSPGFGSSDDFEPDPESFEPELRAAVERLR
jgi:SPP1 gp7 family putative phage head morphogenesis protein